MVNYLCTAGPPFKMHNFPDSQPNALSHWVLGTDQTQQEEKYFDVKKRAAREIATSYGPPSKAMSARFADAHQQQQQQQNWPRVANTTTPQFVNNLVVDDSDNRTGKGLCESPTSVGPDFVNVADGTFCRMSDKTLFPICDADTTDNCFNTEMYQLIINGVAARDSPYEGVLDWTSKGSKRA